MSLDPKALANAMVDAVRTKVSSRSLRLGQASLC
jgi:hypothetical protein